jgi:catecholate siderophore receptor
MPRPLIAVAALLFIATPALAQSSIDTAPVASRSVESGRLTGTVVDPDGRAIAGAHIEAIDAQGTVRAATDSGKDGAFTMQTPDGRYVLSIRADGFAPLSEPVTIPDSPAAPREFALTVARLREDITVTAAAPTATVVTSGTKTPTPLLDVPQSVTVVSKSLVRDQLMMSVADVVRYVPGITSHQGENNRDQVIIRGNSSSADFFVDGVRDDVQYYRDLYNLERLEALKGPNAMIFGRGGGGGVVNRVTKEAGFMPVRELSVLGGSFDQKRLALDIGQAMNMTAAFRVNAMYEDANSFRGGVGMSRYGVNPTVTFLAGRSTRITASYEYFHDDRDADRGITSLHGLPAPVPIETYYGNVRDTFVHADVNLTSAAIEHTRGTLTIRNRSVVGNYDRGYQNYVPGAVTADESRVNLTAYNNHTNRLNAFNQTDVTYRLSTGNVRHLLLAGAEFGRQATDNFRNTGFFNNTATSILVPYADPATTMPVTFRQSATDADNHVTTLVAAAYAQDQIDLSSRVQAIAGVRLDRFDLQYHNNRNAEDLGRVDVLVSPRAGLVFKPVAQTSIYTSYTVSHLPSSGDQFSSLTTITEQVEPERFDNYEIGAKWNVRPELALTTSVYRLDRTNTRSTDPTDPTRIVQTGSQRTNGWELGAIGQVTPLWQIAGGYAHQDAFVIAATASAKAGATVAQVPRHTFSLWNLYQVHPRVGAGLGVVYRTDMFATIDNTVTLPGYTDVDTALYVNLTRRVRLQMNVDNLLDKAYYVNADSNTNISPGTPRRLRVALTAGF